MAQIALYIDETLDRTLTRVARQMGKSKSAWVKEAIQEKVARVLPDEWFALWGSWEDRRTPAQILAEVRRGDRPVRRRALK